jgi:hypothetical protein
MLFAVLVEVTILKLKFNKEKAIFEVLYISKVNLYIQPKSLPHRCERLSYTFTY